VRPSALLPDSLAFIRRNRDVLFWAVATYIRDVARVIPRLIYVPRIEPLLARPEWMSKATPLEYLFSHPSDIYAHLPTLYRETRDRPACRVLELGVRNGDSTLVFLIAAREVGGHVTSVDLEYCHTAHARVAAAGLSRQWTFIEGNDLEIPWTTPIDHLFIDTSHRYEHTLAELRKFEPWVTPGGVISVHDTTSALGSWRAVGAYFAGRSDVRILRYFNNNGLTLIWKLEAAKRTSNVATSLSFGH